MDLLERGRELAEFEAALSEAAKGYGSVVVISGEAGIGKTALVHEFVRSCQGRSPVLWGGCDDLSTPRTLGPFRDIAIQVGGRLKEVLGSGAPRSDVLDAILELLDTGRPGTVVVVEDVHWADGATLDVLKFVGRRIGRMATLLVITYRDEETPPEHAVHLMVGDVPATSVHRVNLGPLSRVAVASLAEHYSGSPEELYEATGGNPFLVSEALSVPDLTASAGVRDAVQLRVARLSPEARDVAEIIAVVPTRLERRLVAELVDGSLDSLEECHRRGLVEYDDNWVWYRHELVREAMEISLAEERRRELNAAVLGELIASSADVARIVHHAVKAADTRTMAEFAPAAARQASAAASHVEALAHFRVAARHSMDLAEEDQALLLSDYTVEAYMANSVAEALEVSETALRLWIGLGDLERQGEILRWQSRFHWWLGHGESAEQAGRAAVDVLERVPGSAELPMAYSTLAQLAMLGQDFQPAVEWSTKAIDTARALGDQATLSHALNNLGSARLRVGDLSGFDLLQNSLDIALEHGFDDNAGRAYANLIWTELDYRLYDLADRHLADGIAFAINRDLGGSLHYMTSERALLRFGQGDWPGAEADLRWVLSRPEEPGITQMPALATRARLAVRRGDVDARAAIEAAWHSAEPTGELQRIAPVAAARAELAWLEEDQEALREAVEAPYALAVSAGQPWVTDELAFWMWRSGELPGVSEDLETPFALQAAGRWEEAAQGWEEIGCPYEQATALADSGDSAQLLRALEMFDSLGASPAAKLVRRKLRRLGVRSVPRGPRQSTRAHPTGLTPRQVEVLGLLAEGRTNADIADALIISPKTVDHHVSAVLAKLGVPSRREAARVAIDLGLVDTTSS